MILLHCSPEAVGKSRTLCIWWDSRFLIFKVIYFAVAQPLRETHGSAILWLITLFFFSLYQHLLHWWSNKNHQKMLFKQVNKCNPSKVLISYLVLIVNNTILLNDICKTTLKGSHSSVHRHLDSSYYLTFLD